jgi:cytochrome c
MFEHFTVKNLNEAQAIQQRLKHMPKGEKLALKYNCLSCHKKEKNFVGPSLDAIAKRYKTNPKQIQESILHGSQGKWKGIQGKVMPQFASKISKEEVVILQKWIASFKH